MLIIMLCFFSNRSTPGRGIGSAPTAGGPFGGGGPHQASRLGPQGAPWAPAPAAAGRPPAAAAQWPPAGPRGTPRMEGPAAAQGGGGGGRGPHPAAVTGGPPGHHDYDAAPQVCVM